MLIICWCLLGITVLLVDRSAVNNNVFLTALSLAILLMHILTAIILWETAKGTFVGLPVLHKAWLYGTPFNN